MSVSGCLVRQTCARCVCVCSRTTCSYTHVSFCVCVLGKAYLCVLFPFDQAFQPWLSSSCNWSLMGLARWVLTGPNSLWMASLNISAHANVRSPRSRLGLSRHHHLAGCPGLCRGAGKRTRGPDGRQEGAWRGRPLNVPPLCSHTFHECEAWTVPGPVHLPEPAHNDQLSLNLCLGNWQVESPDLRVISNCLQQRSTSSLEHLVSAPCCLDISFNTTEELSASHQIFGFSLNP